VALMALGCASSAKPPQACTRFQGAAVVTPGGTAPSLVVCGGAVVQDAPPGSAVTEETLPGGFLVPGLHDAHAHLDGVGHLRATLELTGTRSAAEVAQKLAAFASAHPQGWLQGRGWDQNDWACGTPPCGGDMPVAAILDAVVPDRPVILRRVDGHAAWVNNAALRQLGNPPDPAGGRLLRDAAGQPSGVLVDAAMDLVERLLPAPTDAELSEDLRLGALAARSAGLTAVHQMGLGLKQLALLEDLDRRGQLSVRMFVYLHGTEAGVVEALPASGVSCPSPRVCVQGVKLYADGALGSRGAALLAPYSDEPAGSGLWVTPKAELERLALQVHQRRHQVAIHAIGDAANRTTLDIFSRLPAQGLRHRVEHAQVVAPEDWKRFAALNVVASMQPTHATSDMPWAERRLGPARLRGAYAWKSLLDAGAMLALGSDAPVESILPLWGVYAARTRMDHAGSPAGGWQPHETLDGAATLKGFTAGAAWAVHREKDLGTLQPGARADFTWLSVNPATAEPAELLRATVLGVAVDGQLWRAAK
jgi:predicted amidohydrolase YtcJ